MDEYLQTGVYLFLERMSSQHKIVLVGLFPTNILQMRYMANKNMKIKNMTCNMFLEKRSLL